VLVLGPTMEDGSLDVSFSKISLAIWNDSATVSVTASACQASAHTEST